MAEGSQLSDDTFEQEVIRSPIPVLIDFWAPWCGPCRMLSPVVEELAKDYSGRVKVAKMNTDEYPAAALRYKISAIPTLLFLKNGKVVDQMVGAHPKAEIKKRLDNLIESNS